MPKRKGTGVTKPSVYKTFTRLAIVSSHDEALEELEHSDAIVIVQRGTNRSLNLKCPCDDQHILTLNLDPRLGHAWRLKVAKGELTLWPSVWLETECQCHFMIRRNRVYLYGMRGRRSQYLTPWPS